MKTPLHKAIEIVGGQSALAAKVGVKQGHVWYWLNRQCGLSPAEKVLSVCEATKWKVTPHELRPDIYPNPTDGLPVDQSVAVIGSDVITTIEAGGHTRLSGGGYLYSPKEQERRREDRRNAERRAQERRENDRRHAS